MSETENSPEPTEPCPQCGSPVTLPPNRPLAVGADLCPACGQIPLNVVVEEVYGADTNLQELGGKFRDYLSDLARFQTRWEQEGQPVSFQEAVVLMTRIPWPDPQSPEVWANFGLVMNWEDTEWIEALLDIWQNENETHGDRFWAQEALMMVRERVPEHPLTAEIEQRLASGRLNRPVGRYDQRTNVVRDVNIVTGIGHLQSLGMKPARNEVSSEHSACDAVATARGLFLSYTGVETVWKRRNGTKAN